MTVADDLVSALMPWYTTDLEGYLRAIGTMFDQVETYVYDQVDDDGNVLEPGWSVLLDPDVAPSEALPYLAQWVGERLALGTSDDAARIQIKATPNQLRGTPGSIAVTAQATLVGNKTVYMYERHTPAGVLNADELTIVTLSGETPSSARTLKAILSVTPADIHVNYSVNTIATWTLIHSSFASWTAMLAADATWNDVATTVPTPVGWSVWTV
jgi:hypothetical protein